jgi:hypothetical protein
MTHRLTRFFRSISLLVLGGAIGYGLSDGISDLRQMFLPSAPQTSATEAWNDFGQRMSALGQRILQADFPNATDRDRADGIEHLAHIIVEGLRWEFDHGSSESASLMISNTDTTGWGAPNVDNKYYRARIEGTSTYTLYGNVPSLFEIAIQTSRGDIHQGQAGASETIDLSRLTLDEDGNFTLTISPDPRSGDWLPLNPEHTILSIRTYLVDWKSTDFAKFHLVKEGMAGVASPPLSELEASARLGRAASWIEANIVGWNRWFNTALLGAEDNQPVAPQFVAGGSSTLLYGGIPLRLDEGMAAVIEIDNPNATYFSFQTYPRGWYHPGDFANRQTSLNQLQTHVGTDGKIRFVASAIDPGLPNWLDTEGRNDPLIFFRYIKAEDQSLPEVTIVPQEEVSSLLPGDTPEVDAEERRATISMRQRHVQHRYHN